MVRKYDRAPCAPDGLRYSKPSNCSKFAYVLSLIVGSILGCSHSKQIRADKPYYVTTVVQHKPLPRASARHSSQTYCPVSKRRNCSHSALKTKAIHQDRNTQKLPRRTGCDMDYSHAIRARDRSGHLGQAQEKSCSCSSIWDVHNRLTILKGTVNSSSPNTRPNPKISFKDGQPLE